MHIFFFTTSSNASFLILFVHNLLTWMTLKTLQFLHPQPLPPLSQRKVFLLFPIFQFQYIKSSIYKITNFFIRFSSQHFSLFFLKTGSFPYKKRAALPEHCGPPPVLLIHNCHRACEIKRYCYHLGHWIDTCRCN